MNNIGITCDAIPDNKQEELVERSDTSCLVFLLYILGLLFLNQLLEILIIN